MEKTPKGPGKTWLRRAVVGGVGSGVTLVGVGMIVLPGPALILIPAGLAILATEFDWAADLLQKVKLRSTSAPKSATPAKKSSQEVWISPTHAATPLISRDDV